MAARPPSPANRTPARRRLPAAERRAAILKAAARPFALSGYAATAIADIAAAAEVSHLILYKHFDSKHALYDAVLETARTALADALAAPGAVSANGPTPAAVLGAARANPSGFLTLFRHAAREPEFPHHAEAARTLVESLAAEAQSSVVAPPDARWAARASASFVIDAVLAWVEDGNERVDDRFIAATDAAMRAGVRAWANPT